MTAHLSAAHLAPGGVAWADHGQNDTTTLRFPEQMSGAVAVVVVAALLALCGATTEVYLVPVGFSLRVSLGHVMNASAKQTTRLSPG